MTFFKKGFEAQFFVWIFAVVAGTLILLFFINLSFQHQRTTTLLDERKFVTSFEHQLDALSTSESVSKTLSFRESMTLRFDCEHIFTPTYTKKTSHFLFAPETLQGTSFSLWTQQWEFPFPIAPFYYLQDRLTKIFLIYDGASSSFVKDIPIPSSFTVELLDIRDFNPQELAASLGRASAVHLIFFTSYPSLTQLFRSFPSTQLSAALVDLQTQDITLYTDGTPTFTSYFDDSMLYGLFFAPASYVCLRERAVERFYALLSLYAQKASLLQAKLATQPSCQSLMNDAYSFLQQARAQQDPTFLPEIAEQLTSYNRELHSYDCPTLY